MKYQELWTEYRELLHAYTHLQLRFQEIPKGYIAAKKINGKTYYYLQYSVQGKKKSEYIREEDLPHIQEAIAQKPVLLSRLDENRKEQTRLESAVKILDPRLYRRFVFLKQCADMDAMPVAKRRNALAFAGAMTALEGLPGSDETQKELQDWAMGNRSFTDIYMRTLQKYNVVEVWS